MSDLLHQYSRRTLVVRVSSFYFLENRVAVVFSTLKMNRDIVCVKNRVCNKGMRLIIDLIRGPL